MEEVSMFKENSLLLENEEDGDMGKARMDDENMAEEIDLILFIFYAILIPIIAIFGCIGNLLSVYIIMR